MKRACVIGWPIKHSRSPLIHNYWLKSLGIGGVYEKVAVPPADLQRFIASLSKDGIVGCNVTIPHKEAVMQYVHIADPAQRRVGSINTLFIDQEGRIAGESTDGLGFWRALKDRLPAYEPEAMERVIVIGAGGASRAVIASLVQHTSARITVVARDLAKAGTVCGLIDASRTEPADWSDLSHLLHAADLIVNSTPLGMAGYPDLDVDLGGAKPDAIVYDLVYVPLETGFLRQARQRGLATVDGLGMLLHQAAPGFERWFGVYPVVTNDLRELVIRDIEAAH
jgi:shikimate dehydrogenase